MATLALVGMLTFSSCDDDEAEYHAPVYKSITFTPNPCYPGDEVKATVTYASRGENWYYFKQVFALDDDDNKISEKIKNSDTYVFMPDPPTCTFTAPSAGSHTVKFTATPSSTVGNIYRGTASIEAQLVVSSLNSEEEEEEEEE